MTAKRLDISFGWTWFSQTWLLFSKGRLAILGFAILSVLTTLIFSVLPLIGKPLSGFLYPLLVGGAIRVLSLIDSGQPASVTDFFKPISDSSHLKRYLPICGICTVLMFASGFVGVVLQSGLKQMMEPGAMAPAGSAAGGLSPLSMLFSLVGLCVTMIMGLVMALLCLYGPALIELQNETAGKAMEQSIRLTTINWLPLTVLGFVYGLPALALFIPAGATSVLAMQGAMSWVIPGVLGMLALFGSVLLMVPISFCLPYVIYRETFRELEILEPSLPPTTL